MLPPCLLKKIWNLCRNDRRRFSAYKKTRRVNCDDWEKEKQRENEVVNELRFLCDSFMIDVRLSLMKRAHRPIFGCIWVRKSTGNVKGETWISLSGWISSFLGVIQPLCALVRLFVSCFFFSEEEVVDLKIVIIEICN